MYDLERISQNIYLNYFFIYILENENYLDLKNIYLNVI